MIMAFTKSNVLFTSLVILVTLFGVSIEGTVHKVGDANGWTMMGVDYESWASSRTFQVGDSLVFQYNNELHDVVEVTPNDFALCDMTKPLAKHQTGSDTITLTKPGSKQFICGVNGHCEMGQKLQITVLPASVGPVAASVPKPVRSPSSSFSSSSVSYEERMAPSSLQSGASTKTSASCNNILNLLILFLAILVQYYN